VVFETVSTGLLERLERTVVGDAGVDLPETMLTQHKACRESVNTSPEPPCSIKPCDKFGASTIMLTCLEYQSMSMCKIELPKTDGLISGQAATASVHA
jgi:hypothetical protein